VTPEEVRDVTAITTTHASSHPTTTVSAPAAAPVTVTPVPGTDPAGHRATGWEPHRPVGDSLLRRFVHAYASSFTSPVAAVGGHVVRRDTHVVWDLARPSGYSNGAMLLQPLPYDGWQEVLPTLEADLVPAGRGEVVLFSPWPTPDLGARGWRLGGHPPLLVLPHPGGAASTAAPAWLDVVEVADAATLADWERVAVDGYPFEACRPWRRGQLVDERVLADPAFRAWVGYVDGDAAAIGTAHLAHGITVFTLGVTLPAHRGRGAWEALARRRLAAAPHAPAMGIFSDLSRGPAERLGFVPFERWTIWTRERP
jgi:hypothetical protein